MEVVSAVSGFLASPADEHSEMGLIRKAILRKAHILMDAVSTFLDSDTFHGRIECHYAFYEFLDDGIEVSACLLILVLVSIEPRLVVVRLKIPEE